MGTAPPEPQMTTTAQPSFRGDGPRECSELLRRIGVVIIGRNEGERLRASLASLPGELGGIVYVDSGSDDGSVDWARSVGADIVELDTGAPFTAARARNAGFARLMAIRPEAHYVQFLDGDCTLAEHWLSYAARALERSPDVVAVFGRRREAYPRRSIFNRLCDIEWDSRPLGHCLAFGGDVLVRTEGVRQVDSYDPTVTAAEDDEFSIRLRQAGWRILRLDHEMSVHDADITSLRQWWKRAERAGYAYAQVGAMHGAPPERYFWRERLRVLVWGIAMPLVILSLLLPSPIVSGLLFGLYPLRAVRVAWRSHGKGLDGRGAVAWGVSCTTSVFPAAKGLLKYHADRLRSKQPTIIEYKRSRS